MALLFPFSSLSSLNSVFSRISSSAICRLCLLARRAKATTDCIVPSTLCVNRTLTTSSTLLTQLSLLHYHKLLLFLFPSSTLVVGERYHAFTNRCNLLFLICLPTKNSLHRLVFNETPSLSSITYRTRLATLSTLSLHRISHLTLFLSLRPRLRASKLSTLLPLSVHHHKTITTFSKSHRS